MINTKTRIAVMLDVMDTDGVNDADRAAMGLQCLIAARELFKDADNKRTVERVKSAISSARGAIRIQDYRETRAARAPDVQLVTWSCKRNGHHHGPCNSRCKPRELAS